MLGAPAAETAALRCLRSVSSQIKKLKKTISKICGNLRHLRLKNQRFDFAHRLF
jgi:hypothetical protein